MNVTDVLKTEMASIEAAVPKGDKEHWAFINGWKVEPQYDDRSQMSSAVSTGSGPAAERRSGARRQHQAMFKEWSRNRHD